MKRPDAAAFLETLVRIPSVSGDEHEAAAWLAEQMQALGFDEAHIDDAGSPVGILGDGERVLVMLGHIDTVGGEVPVRRENGKLYGRGSVDAKGPLAAFTLAAAAAGRRPGWKIVVAGAVEEESATARGARAVAAAFRPEACIIGEPSGWQKLCIGYKGRLLVDYSISRPMGHTAGPERSATEIAVEFWNDVVELSRRHNEGRVTRQFDQLAPSLRGVHTSSDGITETVQARIGLRLPPDLSVAALRDKLAALAGGATLAFSGGEPAIRAGKSNALVRAFLAAIRSEDGAPAFVVKTGTADMNVVAPLWQCPILAYGPGDSKLDHTPDEHIDLRELDQAIAVLRRVIMDMTAGPPRP